MTPMRWTAAITLTAVLTAGSATRARAAKAAPPDPAHIAALVRDLHNDPVRFNAERAHAALIEVGVPAVGSLTAALDSDDWQQRQMAADALRWIEWWHKAKVPTSAAMGRVTIEGLRHDGLPLRRRGAERTCNFVFNAKSGTLYLLNHAAVFDAALRAGLNSDDGQQQFLCAFVLGMAGRLSGEDRRADAEAAARVLLPHLRSNDLTGDATLAGAAIYRIGPGVKGLLLRARAEADVQQREVIDLILRDWRNPPTTVEKLKQRRRLHHLGGWRADPVYELTPGDLVDAVAFGWPEGMKRVELKIASPATGR